MLQEYATTVCKVQQHAVYSTNISLHVSMTSKKLFASTMDNKNSSILWIQIVCKAAPRITRVRIQNRKCEQYVLLTEFFQRRPNFRLAILRM
jgi:hypothetical protein